MQIDPTDYKEGNDVADQIIQERVGLKHLRVLLNCLSWSHRIAIAQIACNQIGSHEPPQLIKLKPFNDAGFDDHLQAAITLMGSLPPETLTEIAIEILEEPRDRNE